MRASPTENGRSALHAENAAHGTYFEAPCTFPDAFPTAMQVQDDENKQGKMDGARTATVSLSMHDWVFDAEHGGAALLLQLIRSALPRRGSQPAAFSCAVPQEWLNHKLGQLSPASWAEYQSIVATVWEQCLLRGFRATREQAKETPADLEQAAAKVAASLIQEEVAEQALKAKRRHKRKRKPASGQLRDSRAKPRDTSPHAPCTSPGGSMNFKLAGDSVFGAPQDDAPLEQCDLPAVELAPDKHVSSVPSAQPGALRASAALGHTMVEESSPEGDDLWPFEYRSGAVTPPGRLDHAGGGLEHQLERSRANSCDLPGADAAQPLPSGDSSAQPAPPVTLSPEGASVVTGQHRHLYWNAAIGSSGLAHPAPHFGVQAAHVPHSSLSAHACPPQWQPGMLPPMPMPSTAGVPHHPLLPVPSFLGGAASGPAHRHGPDFPATPAVVAVWHQQAAVYHAMQAHMLQHRVVAAHPSTAAPQTDQRQTPK